MADQNDKPEREQTPEEIATLKAGREDVERRKAQVGQPIPLMTDPMWLLSEEGAPVLAHGLGKNFRGEPVEPRRETVTVLIPKDFRWNATGHHQFLFRQGVREVPASLLDIKWIRDNGVRVWERPDVPVEYQPIMGSASLGDTIAVGGVNKPSGPFLAQAFQASKMSVEQWNALSDEERGTRAIDCATQAGAAQAAAHMQAGGIVPGAGSAVVAPQPGQPVAMSEAPNQPGATPTTARSPEETPRPQDRTPPPNKIAPGPPKK